MPVRYGLLNRAQARHRAIALFKELDLPAPETFGYRYPHQVSGGQLQRAMVAMAMSCSPDVLVLDEPTTALDVTTQIEVIAAIKKMIRDHGTAGLYISHDLAVVAQVADRIMVLRDGQIVEFGTSIHILRNPQKEYTRRLLSVRTLSTAVRENKERCRSSTVEVENLTVAYGSVVAVRNVSLSIAPGETLAVVGESGSGKSTLARAIWGVKEPKAGIIRFKGSPLAHTTDRRSRDQRRQIQLIHQMPDLALNPRQRVSSILGRPLSFYFGWPQERITERVTELLRLVELLPEIADRYPAGLSGGQKQRVCIARALAAEPDLIICDEVSSALDALVAEEVLKLLDRLQRESGVAYMFITHDLGIVHRVADRVAVMLRGEVVAYGNVRDVFSPPLHPYTQKLLSSVPEMRVDWLDEVLRGQASGDLRRSR
jgi:peptide/nickel transport system ATP-binding protein